MNKASAILSILLMVFLHPAKSQELFTNKSIPLTLIRTHLFQHSYTTRFKNFLLISQAPAHQPTIFPLYTFNYTLPRGAIFCRMEESLYKRFNFRIKFRMGTDDRYSN